MKTLNVTFTDEEYERLERFKQANGNKNWHDHFLHISEMKEA
jgi:hypothetical protein